ncbi:transcriptional regulator with XRE-family HTH domain [Paenibacillus mucilaginosus]|uniref:helix-turn-helix domain-containing protein n=1 Tax=Paenibacillus mucilaginosus TaxID=61624 RepID=UPI003D1CDDF1
MASGKQIRKKTSQKYDSVEVGRRIRQIREEVGMKLVTLADRAGISPAKLSYMETGKTKTLNFNDLENIAKVFNMSLLQLLSGLEGQQSDETTEEDTVMYPVDYDSRKVAQRVKALRHEADVKLLDLSAATGFPISKLSYIENGKNKKVNPLDIEAIARVLGVNTDQILNENTRRKLKSDEEVSHIIDSIRGHLTLSRLPEVSSMLDDLVGSIDPNSKYYPIYLRLLGDYYLASGDKQQAIEMYSEVQSIISITRKRDLFDQDTIDNMMTLVHTLYETSDVITALKQNLWLIDRLEAYDTEKPDFTYRHQLLTARYNQSVLYCHLGEIPTAYQYSQETLLKTNENFLYLPHLEYLISLILFLREDYAECRQMLFKALRGFRASHNSRMLTKAISAQYYFHLREPEHFGTLLSFIEDFVLTDPNPCGETCKQNPYYHQIWFKAIERTYQEGVHEKALQLIHTMRQRGHEDPNVIYIEAKIYEKLQNQEKYIELLSKLVRDYDDIENSGNLGGLTPRRLALIRMELLQTMFPQERDFISGTTQLFEMDKSSNPIRMIRVIFPPLLD